MTDSIVADDIVKNEILLTVSSITNEIRINKLRKIICNKLKSTNWNQFHRVLEATIQEGPIKTETVGDEVVILSNGGNYDNAQAKLTINNALTKTKRAVLYSQDMEIPLPVCTHLNRKGQKKKKNIELNTKTSLDFKNIDISDVCNSRTHVGNTNDDQPTTKTATLTITKYRDDHDNNKQTSDDEESKIIAKKHFKSAIYMMEKMVESYRKHPEHFVPPKAGGTFAEQDAAKKRKAAADKSKKKKKKLSKNGHDVNSSIQKTNKRSRKYY